MSDYLTLPRRTEAEVRTERDYLAVAVAWRKIIWRQERNEERKISRLIDVCTKLHDGDKVKGSDLATKAIWSPS